MRRARVFIRALPILVLAACGPAATPPPTPPPPRAPETSPVPSALPRSDTNPEAQPPVDQVLQAAATQLGVSANQLQVDQVEARQWPDSSLGCPQPGNQYSQVVTPGFLIVVRTASGGQLEYHTDARSRVVLCKES
jgi:hypothetical protein